MCGNVLDQGAAGRRRRCACRHLSRARRQSRQRRRSVGLGDGLWASRERCSGADAVSRHAGRTAAGAGRQIMTRAWAVAIVAVALTSLAGCGERPQVINYKQGTYQGKPDTPPYSNAPFNGNRAEWDKAIATRNQNQNEYKRVR